MVRKIIFIFTVSLLAGTASYGQLEPVQSLYPYNLMYLNPAGTGISGKGSVFLWHRSQWMNFEGAPQTEMLSFEYPLRNMAFGANIFYDTDGPMTRFTGSVNYAYLIEINFDTYLSLGVNLGINRFGLDASKINNKDPETFFDANQSVLGITSGIGATMYSERWYVGISSPNVVPMKVVASGPNNSTYFLPHVNLLGGFNYEISYNVVMLPSFVLRYAVDQPLSLDTSVMFTFHDKITAGLSYRFNSAYILLLSGKITDNLMIGYSFDMDATKIRKYNYGSHEVFLRYQFETSSGNVRFQSPRTF
jgi:type IX secretion system PorP/SprF family membrane protein